MLPFVVQYPLLLATGTSAFLAPDFFIGLLAGTLLPQRPFLQPITQLTAGHKPVQFPRSLSLALDFKPGLGMLQKNAGRGFIQLLPAGTSTQNKLLDQVFFKDTQPGHPLFKRLLFFRCNENVCHG